MSSLRYILNASLFSNLIMFIYKLFCTHFANSKNSQHLNTIQRCVHNTYTYLWPLFVDILRGLSAIWIQYIPISPLHFKHFFDMVWSDPKLKESEMNSRECTRKSENKAKQSKGKKREKNGCFESWKEKRHGNTVFCRLMHSTYTYTYMLYAMCYVCVCLCLYTLSSQMGIPFWYIPVRTEKVAAEIVHIILLYLMRSSFFFFFSSFGFYLLFAIILLFLASHSFTFSFFLPFTTKPYASSFFLFFFAESLYAAFEYIDVCVCMLTTFNTAINKSSWKWIVDLACLHFSLSH